MLRRRRVTTYSQTSNWQPANKPAHTEVEITKRKHALLYTLKEGFTCSNRCDVVAIVAAAVVVAEC